MRAVSGAVLTISPQVLLTGTQAIAVIGRYWSPEQRYIKSVVGRGCLHRRSEARSDLRVSAACLADLIL